MLDFGTPLPNLGQVSARSVRFERAVRIALHASRDCTRGFHSPLLRNRQRVPSAAFSMADQVHCSPRFDCFCHSCVWNWVWRIVHHTVCTVCCGGDALAVVEKAIHVH